MTPLSAQEWARALGGKVMLDGRTVRFPRPGKLKLRSCTLKIDPNAPDGYVVADGRKDGIPFEELRDYVREKGGLPPFKNGRKNGAIGSNGSNGHRPPPANTNSPRSEKPSR
jgi:hypothetical protein